MNQTTTHQRRFSTIFNYQEGKFENKSGHSPNNLSKTSYDKMFNYSNSQQFEQQKTSAGQSMIHTTNAFNLNQNSNMLATEMKS